MGVEEEDGGLGEEASSSAPCHPGGASSSLAHSRGDEKLEHSTPDPPFPSSSFLEVNFGAGIHQSWQLRSSRPSYPGAHLEPLPLSGFAY